MEFNWESIPAEEECLAFLEHKRWNGIVESPFSSNSPVYHCKGGRYKCRLSGKYFNVRTNTIFHNSKIPLRKWFAAIAIAQSREVTSVELGKLIGITQKSAWYILRRLKRYEIAVRKSANASKAVENEVQDKLSMTDWLTLLKK